MSMSAHIKHSKSINMRYLVSMLLILSMTGCGTYPYYGPRKPATTVTVIDSQGRPLDKAQVHLVLIDKQTRRVVDAETATTGKTGVIRFPNSFYNIGQTHPAKINSPEVQKKVAGFYYALCIEKKNFSTTFVRYDFKTSTSQTRKFTLRKGRSRSCPGKGASAFAGT